MKRLLPYLLLRLLRNLLLIEIAAVLLAGLFTWRIELYYSETFGDALFATGVALIILFSLTLGLAQASGGQYHWPLWSKGITESVQLDPGARASAYREAMKTRRASLWQLAIFLAAVINMGAGAWVVSQHRYLPFFEDLSHFLRR